MSMIFAPFSAPPDILGIGRHRLEFDEGRCVDPGLNDGERAYLLGRGYRFADGGEVAENSTGDPIPVAEPASPSDPAPAEKPKKAPRTRAPRKTPTTDTAATTAD